MCNNAMYARSYQARQTSMQENNVDCLKAMYLPSRQDIRKFEEVKSVKKFREDQVSKTIEDFFVLNEDGVTWRFNE